MDGNNAELSETIMEINDLRVLLDLSPRRSRSDTKGNGAGGEGQNAFATKELREHKERYFFLRALCGLLRPGQFLLSPAAPLSPDPLQNVKEQAPERRIHTTIPRFDVNTSTNIQLF